MPAGYFGGHSGKRRRRARGGWTENDACVCPVTGRTGSLQNITAANTLACKTPLSFFSSSCVEFRARGGFFETVAVETIADHPEITAVLSQPHG